MCFGCIGHAVGVLANNSLYCVGSSTRFVVAEYALAHAVPWIVAETKQVEQRGINVDLSHSGIVTAGNWRVEHNKWSVPLVGNQMPYDGVGNVLWPVEVRTVSRNIKPSKLSPLSSVTV